MSCLEKLDDCSVSCCNTLCGCLDKCFIPCHFCLKHIISLFERPYSFCFIINFFLLVTPSLLLLILIIQLNQLNESYSNFHFIIGFLFFNLLINFAVTFYIYYIYGIHRLSKENPTTYNDVKLYSSYVYTYLVKTTNVWLILLYYFGQIISTIMCFNWINDPQLVTKYQGLVVYDFSKFAVVCNAIFIFGNSTAFIYLYLFLLCKVNFSCCCKVILKLFFNRNEEGSENNHKDLENKEEELFIVKSSRAFKFFGLYDVDKQFPKKEDNVIKIENE